MAKKVDPFDKFKAATLGKSNELSDAILTKRQEDTSAPLSVPESASESIHLSPVDTSDANQLKPGKNANRELVSFHIPKDIKKKLGLLKYESERSFGDLYTEAIEDLLKKYGKL